MSLVVPSNGTTGVGCKAADVRPCIIQLKMFNYQRLFCDVHLLFQRSIEDVHPHPGYEKTIIVISLWSQQIPLKLGNCAPC